MAGKSQMRAFIDTGAFLAIADKSDTFHEMAANILQELTEQKAILHTSNYIIDETITLIRARVNHNAAVAFIKGLEVSNIKVLHVSEKMNRLQKSYSSNIRIRTSAILIAQVLPSLINTP